MTPIPPLVFHLVQAFGTAKGFFDLIAKKNNCVSFQFNEILRSSDLL